MNAWEILTLDPEIQREPGPGDSLVFWIPREGAGASRRWERIATVPGATPTAGGDYRFVPATALTVQQHEDGLLRLVWRQLRPETNEPVWLLPNGSTALQCGERRTGVLLVWTENSELQEADVASRWPDKRIWHVGPKVFVLVPEDGTTDAGGDARRQAEQLVAAARMQRDLQREASALADLGIACLRDGDLQAAIAHLQDALRLGQERWNPRFQGDVRGSLGLAYLAVGQVGCALQLLDQALSLARSEADRVAEKTALANLGYAFSYLNNPAGAITQYEAALALARELRDRQHEADCLWCLAVQHAELGDRERAIACAAAALQVLKGLASPHEASLEKHLAQYREETTAVALYPRPSSITAPFVASMWTSPASAQPAASGPGLLRMAFNATKSLAQFVGSGFTTVGGDEQRQRLDRCAVCEHHTGMRCRVCGCFTNLKTRLPHEACPLGKWSASL